jgi:3-methyladenine DNA glycosylase/8-oxoguanine DNA glycosylase
MDGGGKIWDICSQNTNTPDLTNIFRYFRGLFGELNNAAYLSFINQLQLWNIHPKLN